MARNESRRRSAARADGGRDAKGAMGLPGPGRRRDARKRYGGAARFGCGRRRLSSQSPLQTSQSERGSPTLDVVANPRARWTGVPEAVWGYHLGGYQVLKKWLSYREEAILGRPLTLDEVRTFSAICRRIAALLAGVRRALPRRRRLTFSLLRDG